MGGERGRESDRERGREGDEFPAYYYSSDGDLCWGNQVRVISKLRSVRKSVAPAYVTTAWPTVGSYGSSTYGSSTYGSSTPEVWTHRMRPASCALLPSVAQGKSGFYPRFNSLNLVQSTFSGLVNIFLPAGGAVDGVHIRERGRDQHPAARLVAHLHQEQRPGT